MLTRNRLVFIVGLSLIVAFVVWTSTRRRIHHIHGLESRIFSFDELPPTVADVFRHTKKYETIGNRGLLISLDTTNIYKLEVEKTGPWVDYSVITKNDEMRFKVPYGKAYPYVIHNNELFIPDRYSIANTELAEVAKYEGYKLVK